MGTNGGSNLGPGPRGPRTSPRMIFMLKLPWFWCVPAFFCRKICPLIFSTSSNCWLIPSWGDMGRWVWVNTYRYIFSGMNIHLPAILGFTRYQGFDPSPDHLQRNSRLLGHLGLWVPPSVPSHLGPPGDRIKTGDRTSSTGNIAVMNGLLMVIFFGILGIYIWLKHTKRG